MEMSYTSLRYWIMVLFLVPVYYVLPKKYRWWVLLAGSIFFYAFLITHVLQALIFMGTVLVSYLFGLLIEKTADKENRHLRIFVLTAGILLSAGPFLLWREIMFVAPQREIPIIPVGISFYTLQIIAYLTDIHRGKIHAQHDLLKYALFISFFPQIIQGPIPRYELLQGELYEGNDFEPAEITGGMQLILWGIFLKLVIADPLSVPVNTVFDSTETVSGAAILSAAFFYSIQLYTDFLSCTVLSLGTAQLFGIRLGENFMRPYFADSVKEFWRRWHISLSTWLRDYVYIPLGGNRKGHIRQFLNLTAVFLVSGLWHGSGAGFLVWGLMHAAYQIVGELLSPVCAKVPVWMRRAVTFLLVMTAWIIFRADTLAKGTGMIMHMIKDSSSLMHAGEIIFTLGLKASEMAVLAAAVLVLLCVSILQEKGIQVRSLLNKQNTAVRWLVYFLAVWVIWIFGAYGHGFETADFIYGGF